jgi:hypothetical protein
MKDYHCYSVVLKNRLVIKVYCEATGVLLYIHEYLVRLLSCTTLFGREIMLPSSWPSWEGIVFWLCLFYCGAAACRVIWEWPLLGLSFVLFLVIAFSFLDFCHTKNTWMLISNLSTNTWLRFYQLSYVCWRSQGRIYIIFKERKSINKTAMIHFFHYKIK